MAYSYYPGAKPDTTNLFFITSDGKSIPYHTNSVYNSGSDPQQYGLCSGILRRCDVGGCLRNSSITPWGSRSCEGYMYSATSHDQQMYTSRGCNKREVSWGEIAFRN